MCTGDLCQVPPAAVHHGRAKQCSGTGPCGYCRRVLWVPGPRGQYSVNIRFIEKPWVQDEGVAMWLNVVLTPRIAYPEVNDQVRSLVRVVGIVAPFAPQGFSIRGKFVLSIGQARSCKPALTYFQIGGMKHDQELFAKVSYRSSMRRELYADL